MARYKRIRYGSTSVGAPLTHDSSAAYGLMCRARSFPGERKVLTHAVWGNVLRWLLDDVLPCAPHGSRVATDMKEKRLRGLRRTRHHTQRDDACRSARDPRDTSKMRTLTISPRQRSAHPRLINGYGACKPAWVNERTWRQRSGKADSAFRRQRSPVSTACKVRQVRDCHLCQDR